MRLPLFAAVSAAALFVAGVPAAIGQDATSMSFFVTSVGLGDGANLGGIEGADAHCQQLAEAAGSSGMTWRAYLSAEGVNAMDRIGSGPWVNANGDVVAQDVASLHSDANNITKETALTELGEIVPGRGDQPNQHDILTGTNADGTLAAGMTCNDWTSNAEGSAMVGHSDRMGLDESDEAKSWNASHPSRGCSQEGLIGTGGNGYFYCFAAN